MRADLVTPPRTEPPRWRPRIRVLLLALALAVALPIIALAGWLGTNAVREATESAEASVLATARLVVAGIEIEQTRIGHTLGRLARHPGDRAPGRGDQTLGRV